MAMRRNEDGNASLMDDTTANPPNKKTVESDQAQHSVLGPLVPVPKQQLIIDVSNLDDKTDAELQVTINNAKIAGKTAILLLKQREEDAKKRQNGFEITRWDNARVPEGYINAKNLDAARAALFIHPEFPLNPNAAACFETSRKALTDGFLLCNGMQAVSARLLVGFSTGRYRATEHPSNFTTNPIWDKGKLWKANRCNAKSCNAAANLVSCAHCVALRSAGEPGLVTNFCPPHLAQHYDNSHQEFGGWSGEPPQGPRNDEQDDGVSSSQVSGTGTIHLTPQASSQSTHGSSQGSSFSQSSTDSNLFGAL
jgi:hypothetical protein